MFKSYKVQIKNFTFCFLEWQPCHSFAEGVDVFFFFITLKFQSQAIWYKILFQIIFLYLYEQPIFALAVYFLPLQFQPSCSVFNDHQCDQNYQILIFYSYEFIPIQLIGCTAIFLPLQFQPSCSVFDDHQCDQNYQILIFYSFEFIQIQLIGCTA